MMTYEIPTLLSPVAPDESQFLPEQVLSYIGTHPGSTVNDVMGYMQSTRSAAKLIVRRLEEADRIHRISKEGATRIRFVAGPKPKTKAAAKRPASRDHPHQVMTDTWAPPPVSPQSWLSALEWEPGSK